MAVDYDAPRLRDDDANESLEEVKAAQAKVSSQQPNAADVDDVSVAESFELPGADLSHETLEISVTPQQDDEFVCTQCFLVRHHTQRAKAGGTTCIDCD
jgi:hypothetical protein